MKSSLCSCNRVYKNLKRAKYTPICGISRLLKAVRTSLSLQRLTPSSSHCACAVIRSFQYCAVSASSRESRNSPTAAQSRRPTWQAVPDCRAARQSERGERLPPTDRPPRALRCSVAASRGALLSGVDRANDAPRRRMAARCIVARHWFRFVSASERVESPRAKEAVAGARCQRSRSSINTWKIIGQKKRKRREF